MSTRRFNFIAVFALILILVPVLLFVMAAMLIYPTLPPMDALTDYHPKIPLRVYTAEGVLLGEFGEERREMVKISDLPDIMKKAILAAEDDRFYQHVGVDFIGVMRALFSNISTGETKQGASTITMQVARNFLLSNEKTFSRKFNEMLLAFKIEFYLSKDEIMQLYINHIFLGQHSYGFAAASQIYFGKPLDQISIAEAAMLAGLPKSPSTYNPVVNPKRARLREQYILRRMHELNFIDDSQYKLATNQTVDVKQSVQDLSTKSEYLAEMVRQAVYRNYREDTYTQGLKVYTTIREQDQLAAYKAVRKGVLEYDLRHGYRGPEGFVDLRKGNSEEILEEALQNTADSDDLLPAVVLAASATQIHAYCKGGERIIISGEALHFAQSALSNKIPLSKRIVPGSIIRAKKNEQGIWEISQVPQVEAAFVSGNPTDGAIYSLIGGFDFNHNQFNHITQAWRQPGSSFKPFIYSAALENGFSPDSIFDDEPFVLGADDSSWHPKNYDDKYEGPMTMRQALIKSKNMVSIRILQAITPQYAQKHIAKFGLSAIKHPSNLTMALGAGSVTPIQMFTGFSVFANGGFHIYPYFIRRIENSQGRLISETIPNVANLNAEQIIDGRNASTMANMMQDVVRHGTASRAMQLGRQDLAGKTGTTSDSVDAWFCGFQRTLVGISWIGFDQPRSLGGNETGSSAALPIWISYMKKTLQNVPQAEYSMPSYE